MKLNYLYALLGLMLTFNFGFTDITKAGPLRRMVRRQMMQEKMQEQSKKNGKTKNSKDAGNLTPNGVKAESTEAKTGNTSKVNNQK